MLLRLKHYNNFIGIPYPWGYSYSGIRNFIVTFLFYIIFKTVLKQCKINRNIVLSHWSRSDSRVMRSSLFNICCPLAWTHTKGSSFDPCYEFKIAKTQTAPGGASDTEGCNVSRKGWPNINPRHRHFSPCCWIRCAQISAPSLHCLPKRHSVNIFVSWAGEKDTAISWNWQLEGRERVWTPVVSSALLVPRGPAQF